MQTETEIDPTNSPTKIVSSESNVQPAPRPGTRNISVGELLQLQKFPCDGVLRYSVEGSPRHSYGVAYEGLIAATGCKRAPNGSMVYTAEGIRRIKSMNRHYLRTSHDFVRRTMHAQNQAMIAALRAAPPATTDAPPLPEAD